MERDPLDLFTPEGDDVCPEPPFNWIRRTEEKDMPFAGAGVGVERATWMPGHTVRATRRLQKYAAVMEAAQTGDVGEVARRYGLTEQTLRRAFKTFGVRTPPPRVPLRRQKKKQRFPISLSRKALQIIRDIQDPILRLADIAELHGVPYVTIRKMAQAMREAGIKMPAHPGGRPAACTQTPKTYLESRAQEIRREEEEMLAQGD